MIETNKFAVPSNGYHTAHNQVLFGRMGKWSNKYVNIRQRITIKWNYFSDQLIYRSNFYSKSSFIHHMLHSIYLMYSDQDIEYE